MKEQRCLLNTLIVDIDLLYDIEDNKQLESLLTKINEDLYHNQDTKEEMKQRVKKYINSLTEKEINNLVYEELCLDNVEDYKIKLNENQKDILISMLKKTKEDLGMQECMEFGEDINILIDFVKEIESENNENKKLYNLKLNEFEVLTLREGLFKCLSDDTITQGELKEIDNKIKKVFKNDD